MSTATAPARNPEFELIDTGVFDQDRYFDIFTEYAKADAERHPDPRHRGQSRPRGRDAAPAADAVVSQHLDLETRSSPKPTLRRSGDGIHAEAGERSAPIELTLDGQPPLLFTENETNAQALWNWGDPGAYVKDAFHRHVIHGETDRP